MTKVISQEEEKYKRKYEELLKKLQDLEENNKNLDLKIKKTRKCIKRLKVEKGFLFEKLDKIKKTDFDSDDSEIENNPPPQVKIEEKHRKKQKHIDPLAPKKPANAFFRFCQMQRKDLKSQIKSEDSSNSDVTKILSNRWKELPQEQKQIYYDMYEKDKARYTKELEAYNTNSEHKKGMASPISSEKGGRGRGRSKGKGSSTKIRMNSISTVDDIADSIDDDTLNSINDTQTETSYNNTTNNDDDNDNEMQIDDDKTIESSDPYKASSTSANPYKEGREETPSLSRNNSIDYSGETAPSNTGESNRHRGPEEEDEEEEDNDRERDEEEDEEDNDEEEEEEDEEDEVEEEENDNRTKLSRPAKKYSLDSQDEIEESQEEDESQEDEEEEEEVEEEEEDEDQVTNDDETEGMDEDTQIDEEEDNDSKDD